MLSIMIWTIDTSNTVDGKPVYYWINEQDKQVPSDAGYVGIVSSQNITVTNLTLTNNWQAVLFAYTSNSKIENVCVSNNGFGIYLHGSNNNSILSNDVLDNGRGIWVEGEPGAPATSCFNIVSGNDVRNNSEGLYLRDTSYNTISGNIVQNNTNGIQLFYSSFNSVSDNTIQNNWYPFHDYHDPHGCGVFLDYQSSNNILSGNVIQENRCYGILLWDSSSNEMIDNMIQNNEKYGIYLDESSLCNILSGNVVKNNSYGILIYVSDSSAVFGNIVCDNTEWGILLAASSNCTVYHNDIINNTVQAYDDGANAWDNGYPSGGNYWSNYTGLDTFSGPYQNETGSDGIGDSVHIVDLPNIDRYPLMKPHVNLHDVGIVNVANSKNGCLPKPTVCQGYSVNITTRIFNYGICTETFNLTIYVNTTAIQTIINITLTGGNSTIIIAAWNTTGFAYGDYTISAIVDTMLDELDTSDNAYVDGIVYIGIPGDVNADREVDVKDVYAVARSYGTSLEGPNPPGRTYSPNCDINDDGEIEVRDYYITCRNYGKTEP